jgi:D-alanine-D-alanine ligase
MVTVEHDAFSDMARILILWNQIDDDVYEHYRRDGKRAPDWDPTLEIEPWQTVEQEIELIQRVLIDGGHSVSHYNILDSFQNLFESVTSDPPDCVVNLVEFFNDDPEQEHNVPALFELLNIPYTGNRPLALSLCQRKPQAKALLTASGLPTPRGVVIEKLPVPAELGLRFPMIVKPAHDDASGGIDAGSVVHDRAELEARVKLVLTEHTMAALVEEYIAGREVHCAILGTEALPLYEMQFKGGVDDQGRTLPHIITYRAKWDPYSRDHYAVESKCPPDDLTDEQVAEIQEIALRAFRTVGCRDYARVDMRLEEATGRPYILEVNPNPDLADSCAFAQCVRASGRTYGQAMNELVHYALERTTIKPNKRYTGPTDTLLSEYLARRTASK